MSCRLKMNSYRERHIVPKRYHFKVKIAVDDDLSETTLPFLICSASSSELYSSTGGLLWFIFGCTHKWVGMRRLKIHMYLLPYS